MLKACDSIQKRRKYAHHSSAQQPEWLSELLEGSERMLLTLYPPEAVDTGPEGIQGELRRIPDENAADFDTELLGTVATADYGWRHNPIHPSDTDVVQLLLLPRKIKREHGHYVIYGSVSPYGHPSAPPAERHDRVRVVVRHFLSQPVRSRFVTP